MIIISGTLDFPPESIDTLLAECRPLIQGALTEPGCLDYDWCPNPMIPGQIRVFERWTDQASLQAHFDCEWYHNMADTLNRYGMLGADVLKYKTAIIEPVYDDSGTPRADFFSLNSP